MLLHPGALERGGRGGSRRKRLISLRFLWRPGQDSNLRPGLACREQDAGAPRRTRTSEMLLRRQRTGRVNGRERARTAGKRADPGVGKGPEPTGTGAATQLLSDGAAYARWAHVTKLVTCPMPCGIDCLSRA